MLGGGVGGGSGGGRESCLGRIGYSGQNEPKILACLCITDSLSHTTCVETNTVNK